MFVRFVIPGVGSSGGLFLAAYRLATVLTEAGHRCELTVPPSLGSAAASGITLQVRIVDELPETAHGPVADKISLRRGLSAGAPDLLIIGHGSFDVLDASASVGPTMLHAHVSWPACPDATRYWHRVGRPCAVRAGVKCLALRPALGCGGRAEVVTPRYVLNWHRLIKLLASETVGTIAISGPQAALMCEHGIPEDKLTVLPNLGMRMQPREIADAAANVPEGDRSAVAYFGRLSKAKGASMLPRFAARAPAPGLRIFGDGYLGASLAPALGDSLRGNVPQHQVAGVLAWARAVVFPSRWPEPGGIVGLDAQLFGVPLASFALGAALDWPATELFKLGDSNAMAAWLASQPTVFRSRDADAISARQAIYWGRVQQRASAMLNLFATTGMLPPLDLTAVGEDLRCAMAS